VLSGLGNLPGLLLFYFRRRMFLSSAAKSFSEKIRRPLTSTRGGFIDHLKIQQRETKRYFHFPRFSHMAKVQGPEVGGALSVREKKHTLSGV